MPEPRDQPTGQPHQTNWFWNLLGLYDRQSRPMASYYDDTAEDEAQYLQDRVTQLQRLFTLGADRRRKYEVFEEMDTYGLVSAILDTYAAESTQRDYDRGVTAWIESRAPHMRKAGEDALHNCKVEDTITWIVRRFCKYGDAYQRLLYQTGKGVLGWKAAPTPRIERRDDKYGRLVGFSEEGQKYRQAKRDVSWPWDYVHFRLLGKEEESGYGTSLLENMFRDWRRMTLTEESILMYRLRRMPDRNLIQVNVGNMEEHTAMAYVNAFRKKLRKHEMVDPASPSYRKQYNPLTPLEDIFLPLIEGREHRVETLSGSGNVGDVFDLEHFRDAFFGSANAMKAYFGFEGDINAKATLQQQDVRFARAIKRVQRAAIYGLRQMCDIHFTLLQDKSGKDPDRYNFQKPENAYLVQMTPISFLDEFERLEMVQLRQGIIESHSQFASTLQLDPRIWATYLLLNYAKLPEEMVLKLVNKTPDTPLGPVVGGGPGFESLSAEQKRQVLDNKGGSRKGYYALNEAEQIAIARCVHMSPRLRKSLATWAEYTNEDLLVEGLQQTDKSLVPPIFEGTLSDDAENTAHARQLAEDLKALTTNGSVQTLES